MYIRAQLRIEFKLNSKHGSIASQLVRRQCYRVYRVNLRAASLELPICTDSRIELWTKLKRLNANTLECQ
jgi:hypothetical protein